MKIYSIGRGEMNTIHVDNEYVSRQHALLKVDSSGKMEIMDKSSNGTSINGRRLKPNVYYKVRRKDVVTFAGQVQLDWDLIHDPVKGFKIAGFCLLILLVLAGGFFVLKPYLFKDPPPSSGVVVGNVAVKETPEQPADTTKQKESNVDVKKELSRMKAAEDKQIKKRKEDAQKKEDVSDTSEGQDTTAKAGVKMDLSL